MVYNLHMVQSSGRMVVNAEQCNAEYRGLMLDKVTLGTQDMNVCGKGQILQSHSTGQTNSTAYVLTPPGRRVSLTTLHEEIGG